jgi:hypothetical protein
MGVTVIPPAPLITATLLWRRMGSLLGCRARISTAAGRPAGGLRTDNFSKPIEITVGDDDARQPADVQVAE